MVEDRISHYRVLEQVGRGGMGLVYRAQDIRLERTVALKFLPRSLTCDPLAHARLLREARAASALDHPNICTVYEIDEGEDGRPFIAMAFCDGEDVQAKIDRGPLPIEAALEIAIQVAQGLEAAHAAGIVHRDVKPGNILVSERGVVKLVDFGTAKILRAGEASTAEGLSGTPAYMSPEQLEGGKIDARTDVWSLGVVLFEMLTGGRPFGGKGLTALLQAVIQGEPQRVSELRPETPGMISAIIERALRKNPKDRYPSMAAMLEDLRLARRLLEEPTLQYPAGVVPPRPPRASRALRLPWLLTGLVVLLVLALGWFVRDPAPGSRQPPDAPASPRPSDDLEAFRLSQTGGGLADAYRLLGGEGDGVLDPRVAASKAKAAALRALELDPRLAEAHSALAQALMTFDWDWAGAERSFRTAIELKPSDAAAHQGYAELLSARGRHDEAAREIAAARALDPLSPSIHNGVGLQRYFAGDFAQAAEALRANLEVAPDFWVSHVFLSFADAAMGRSAEAVASARRAVEISGGAMPAVVAEGYALALAGEREPAQKIVDQLAARAQTGYVSPSMVAYVDTALGERERALSNLERAVLERDPFILFIAVMAPFEPLRGDPRFERVLAAVGLRAGAVTAE